MFETELQIWLTIMALLCLYNYGIDDDQGVYTLHQADLHFNYCRIGTD